MTKYLVESSELTAIANAIRAKKNISTPLVYPNDFTNNINNITVDDVATKVATGNIVNIQDAAALIAQNCEVDIQPVQDLHGYSNPWPAGGGKNKLDAEGTFTNLATSLVIKTLTLKPNTQYTASTNHPIGSGTTAATLLADMTETLSTGTCGFWNGTSRTKTTDENGQLRIAYRLVDSETAATFLAYNYQLEEGSAATSYSPYSNICPISGHTSVSVARTGVNVWNEEWDVGSINDSTGEYISGNYIRSKNKIPIISGASYYMVKPSTVVYCYFYDANSNYMPQGTTGYLMVSNNNHGFTAPEGSVSFAFLVNTTYGNTYNHDISINYPSTDHDYHSGAGDATFTTAIPTPPGVVYGGTLDLVSGELVVDRAIADLGDLTWTYYTTTTNPIFYADISNGKKYYPVGVPVKLMCSTYPAQSTGMYADDFSQIGDKIIGVNHMNANKTRILVRDDTYTNASDFKAAMAGVKIAYELRTPVSYQCDPATIKLLPNNNIIISTANNNIKLKYYTNAVNNILALTYQEE